MLYKKQILLCVLCISVQSSAGDREVLKSGLAESVEKRVVCKGVKLFCCGWTTMSLLAQGTHVSLSGIACSLGSSTVAYAFERAYNTRVARLRQKLAQGKQY